MPYILRYKHFKKPKTRTPFGDQNLDIKIPQLFSKHRQVFGIPNENITLRFFKQKVRAFLSPT